MPLCPCNRFHMQRHDAEPDAGRHGEPHVLPLRNGQRHDAYAADGRHPAQHADDASAEHQEGEAQLEHDITGRRHRQCW